MKIKTWIKYEESYLPTPRCRKLRYRECEEYIYVNLNEVSRDELKLAFEDNSYEGKGKIYFYNGKLWNRVKLNSNIAQEYGFKDALEDLVWSHEHCSTYFRSEYDRVYYGKDTSKAAVVKAANDDMECYMLVNGELYKQTTEPRYEIITFGLGHNHGGTGMFCSYGYNSNIGKENYFSALQGEQAVAFANRIAESRGDTNNIGKFEPFIVCHMPELVEVDPDKQHGNGNSYLNDMENIISGSNDPMEAALLCMAMTADRIQ